jgi:DNA-binding GntR family transcriptional regulator
MTRWEALAESIREQIRGGRLKPGDRLPSYADLEKSGLDYPVSYGTVRMAVNVLKAEGWVTSQQGIGMFVRGDPGRPVKAVE